MASIDDRVVAMSFENGKFESGVSQSLSTLDKLKAALRLDGAGKGLDDIEAKSGRLNFGPLSGAVDGLSGKFSAMSVVAVTALATIANKALTAGADIVKSLTIGPISGGLKEYETNLNSVQTILANTAASGADLKDVNAALLELNQYADKTIYNFGEMAKNIGTFTAAGVDLETSTQAIKGIANLAAVSGSNSQQASTAMYQLSQAISSGRVSLQDWNSVVNAGMGGTVFQRALAQTAEKMGTLSKGSVELTGKMKNVSIQGESFRESIMAKPGEQSWLTSKVLTETLKQFTGDMTDAELAAQGFSKAQIKAIQDQAQMAVKAATEVKTLSGVLDTAKEAAGSGWAQTWQIIFGDFGEAKELFTGVSNAINGFIGASADARNKVLTDWKELGGRTALIETIKNVFEALSSVVKPIKEAFREIFPATTGRQLYELTVRLRDFTETLKIGPETSENLKRSFKGLFAVLDIGKQILGGLWEVVKTLFGSLSSGSGGFLDFTAKIGDSLVKLDEWLKEGDRLKNFFKALGAVLAEPIQLLGKLKDVVKGFFDGVDAKDGEALLGVFGGIGDRLAPLSKVLEGAKTAWDGLVSVLERVKEKVQPALDAIGNAFNSIASTIANAIANQDFDTVFEVLQTGLLGGILLAIKKALGGGLKIDFGGGALEKLGDAFDALTGSLKTMQANVQANTLLQIAAAMGVLAIAVVSLSKVDADDLAKSMTAIAVGFGQLVGAMAILNKGVGTGGFLKIPFIAGSLILLGGAINVLALAVRQLSGLSWEELAKGLGGVGALLIGVSLAVKPLSAGSANLVLVGTGLIAIGIALRILAKSVEAFGEMDWGTIGKGLLGVAGALVAVGLAVTAIPPSVLLIGPGLIAVGAALGLIAGAVLAFGSMKLGTLAKGIGGVAASLLAIGAAMWLMPPHMPLMAAGLILVGAGLTVIAGAVALMGNLSISTLAKGIGAIAATLVVLAAGLTAMVASLPGAAALLVAAAALAVLAPVIGLLGNMGWGTIGKGLVAIAASLLVIGTAGAIAAPALTILGAALIVLGAGITLVGAGIYTMAKGFEILANDGLKGVAVVIAALTGLVAIMPKIVIEFAKGLVGIVDSITKLAPQVVEALAKILIMLLDVIIKAAPKMAEAFTALLQAGLKVLVDNVPDFIEKGTALLRALLKGISDNIEEVTNSVITIVLKFLTTLTGRLPEITRAGADALVALLKGVADNLGKVISAAGDVVVALIRGVVDQHGKILSAGVDALLKFLAGIAGKLGEVIEAGGNIIISFITGIGKKAADIARAGRETVIDFINAVATEALKLGKEGADAVINFLNGAAAAIRDKAPQLRAAGANLAKAIMEGILGGLSASSVIDKLVGIAGSALDAVKKKLGIKSPSKEFMKVGSFMMEGWAIGLDDASKQVTDSIEGTVDSMLASISKIPDMLDGVVDMNPVIRPVLDLSNIQVGARQMNGILGSASVVQAESISAEEAARRSVSDEVSSGGVTEVKFEQNNYSPKALSEVEIFRKTKNQLSQVKSALQLT